MNLLRYAPMVFVSPSRSASRVNPVLRARLWRPSLWSLLVLGIAALVVGPILALVWLAFNPTENIWPHLMDTVLPRYLTNTVLLSLGVRSAWRCWRGRRGR